MTAPTNPAETTAPPAPRDLATLGVGITCTVNEVALDTRDRLRLAEIGIRPGVAVTIMGRTSGGGRLLAFGTGRVALDRTTAHHITAHVTDVGAETPAEPR